MDAYDTWLELKAVDDKGQDHLLERKRRRYGKGPVEKGAHFYRALQVDKRRASHQQTQRMVNSRCCLRAPDSARCSRYGPLPVGDSKECREQNHASRTHVLPQVCLVQHAILLCRHTLIRSRQKADVAPDYDDRQIVFAGDLKGVSAKEEKIPDVPTVALAEDEVTLQVIDQKARPLPRKSRSIQKNGSAGTITALDCSCRET